MSQSVRRISRSAVLRPITALVMSDEFCRRPAASIPFSGARVMVTTADPEMSSSRRSMDLAMGLGARPVDKSMKNAVLALLLMSCLLAGTATGVATARAVGSQKLGAGRMSSRATSSAAVRLPRQVALAMTRSRRALYVVLNESTLGHATKYAVDQRDKRAEIWVNRKVDQIQIGTRFYVYEPERACYLSATRSAAVLPDVSGMLLPSHLPGVRYAVKQRQITWHLSRAGQDQLHGIVTLTKAHRISTGKILSRSGVSVTAVVSYPTTMPRIETPRPKCPREK